MALSIQDIIDNISEVIQGMDGNAIAQLHNAICSNKVEYIGDSMFDESVSAELIRFLLGRNWAVESYREDDSEATSFCVITPEGEDWSGYGSEAAAWRDILRQDKETAAAWEQAQ